MPSPSQRQSWTRRFEEKLKEAQPTIEMKGFRKGKVPMALLRKPIWRTPDGRSDAGSIDSAVRDHLDSSGDRPAGQPEMKMSNPDWKPGDDVLVDVSYEKLPDIPAVDFAKITLERMVVKADDAAVQEALDNLAASPQAMTYETKKPKPKRTTRSFWISWARSMVKRLKVAPPRITRLVLGSNSFIPGFEDGLLKVKTGDVKDVEVTFPEEYQAAHLAGKTAVFTCTIKDVRAPKAPEINDELAAKFGAGDLATLKTQIADRLEAEYSGASRALAKRALLDALDGVVSFDLPKALVEAEANQIAHQLWHEENPDVHGHDHPEITPTDEHKSLAERRVKLGLLLADIGQKADVKVTDQEMTQAIMTQARQYPGQERQFFEFVQQNAQFRQQLQAPMFEDKVVDHIFAAATVTEKDVSKEDLQKAVEKLEEE